MKNAERDREATEKRLLETVGSMIAERGFERIGINAIAAQSGVSKILIYRYFGSVEGLLAAYIRQYDFWINLPSDIPERDQLPRFLKTLFRHQINRLRSDVTLRRLYRWELSSNNETIAKIREQRERAGMEVIRTVCRISGLPQAEIETVSAMLSASVTYLIMLSDFCPVYNGIAIDDDSGWERIIHGIDSIIDKLLP
ncbi:TetR/AcrR family transcriptional regulator [Alistipes sp.]|uniref:TetR/AcrR family transcriptional regulator n=1 Tax=Alistipes sp. TaxID=1872444 RepID=UPI003AF0BECA